MKIILIIVKISTGITMNRIIHRIVVLRCWRKFNGNLNNCKEQDVIFLEQFFDIFYFSSEDANFMLASGEDFMDSGYDSIVYDCTEHLADWLLFEINLSDWHWNCKKKLISNFRVKHFFDFLLDVEHPVTVTLLVCQFHKSLDQH